MGPPHVTQDLGHDVRIHLGYIAAGPQNTSAEAMLYSARLVVYEIENGCVALRSEHPGSDLKRT